MSDTRPIDAALLVGVLIGAGWSLIGNVWMVVAAVPLTWLFLRHLDRRLETER